MEQLKEHIMRILSEKGNTETHEEYQQKISRMEMMSALSLLGFDKEHAEQALEALCADGTLAIDESSIYQYDNPTSL